MDYPVAGYRVHGAQITAQPSDEFSANRRAVRTRYGIPGRTLKHPARALHAIHKLVSGAYRRQLAARARRGTDLRWIHPEVGPDGFNDLMRVYYGDR